MAQNETNRRPTLAEVLEARAQFIAAYRRMEKLLAAVDREPSPDLKALLDEAKCAFSDVQMDVEEPDEEDAEEEAEAVAA